MQVLHRLVWKRTFSEEETFMSTPEERLTTLEYDLKQFKTETIKAYQDMAMQTTMVKGLTEDAVRRLLKLRTQVEQGFDRVDKRLDGMDRRFDGIDQRFDGMDRRFEGIDQRLDGMDQCFDGMDQRFDGIDQRFDGMDQRFDGVDRCFS